MGKCTIKITNSEKGKYPEVTNITGNSFLVVVNDIQAKGTKACIESRSGDDVYKLLKCSLMTCIDTLQKNDLTSLEIVSFTYETLSKALANFNINVDEELAETEKEKTNSIDD